MKIFYKILPVVILLSAIITLNLTAVLEKPSYNELLVINLKPQTSNYEYLKQLDEPVILTHTVKKNENINTIAKKYGTDVSTIRGINNLESVILKPQQNIFVINKKGHIHTVKKGETIETIAKKYKVNDETILLANGLVDFEEPEIGDKIFIPGIKIHFADFLWPAINCRITSRFGLRRHPIFRDRRFHEGLDLARWYGTLIRASSDGKVIFAGRQAGYGKMIIIRHKNGFSTRYGHLRSYFVKKGQFVKAGQTIGKMGSTGYSTGPHLHFEVRKYNRPMNPLKYLGK
ncbi:MAG: peptidoglycan DD-metalloendopeptidase family protein [Elusimicrobia bacterium]|nr:peptidoglycan DD-metalloendopeptidase family protein [Elusimicrobiota bacterium]